MTIMECGEAAIRAVEGDRLAAAARWLQIAAEMACGKKLADVVGMEEFCMLLDADESQIKGGAA